MGQFFCRNVGTLYRVIFGQSYGTSGELENPRQYLRTLKESFFDQATVVKYSGATTFGQIDHHWSPSHTEEMRAFVHRALTDPTLLVRITVWDHQIKTGRTHLTLKIMESEEQDRMLRGITEVPGKAVRLTRISSRYSPQLFQSSGWFGSWYDGRLCGKIVLD